MEDVISEKLFDKIDELKRVISDLRLTIADLANWQQNHQKEADIRSEFIDNVNKIAKDAHHRIDSLKLALIVSVVAFLSFVAGSIGSQGSSHLMKNLFKFIGIL